MKRKFDEDSLCKHFDLLLNPAKKIKALLPFPLWKNIFGAPSFEKKEKYSYSEVCEILNKHDKHLMDTYLKMQTQTNNMQLCKVLAIK